MHKCTHLANEVESFAEQALIDFVAERLDGRDKVSSIDFIDHLHRKEILNKVLLKNPMYKMLASGTMTFDELSMFFSDYYHGSNKGFIAHTLKEAELAYENPQWIRYISDIRAEEKIPECHSLIFSQDLKTLGLKISRSHLAKGFIDANVRGYTLNLAYSSGYALAVEIEADYQIYLVYQALVNHFGSEKMKDLRYFDAHLHEGGELEHAKMTCAMVESAYNMTHDFNEIKRGFNHAIEDTERFMVDIYQRIYKSL